ncbi:MarR family winged helix-turn-helix transcriptional regulator [Kutzneria sp. NPDC052558]|uniref:MarR family winged helix-turn-helix transcriptional regulator n=1 Tax=Kutzneria sp. NPDC052558 TaxID=3364121 RepID=UPI0037C6F42D
MATSGQRRTPDLGVTDSLVQLSFLVQGVLARIAAEHDLSLQQVRLLGVLRDRELGMAALADVLELDKSSATGLIARAERRGLVQRAAVPEDRRAVRVRLTDEARRLVAVCAAEVDREMARLVQGLTETNRGRLSRLASQVVHHEAERQGIDLSVADI